MKEILDKYNDCDSFSLTYPDEDIFISEEEKDNAIKEIVELTKKELQKKYNKIYKKYNLIEFEELYSEIENECIELSLKHKNEYNEEDTYEYSFASDFVGEETKYSEPYDFFWEFYHEVGLNLDRKDLINKLCSKNHKMNPLEIIESDTLKNNLIKYEISFYNHCTVSGNIMVNFYFKLNDDTKELLNTFRSDFDINIDSLEDLALYKNNKLIFSSCTHEYLNNLGNK